MLREVAILRVGYLSQSRYETFQHEAAARLLKMTDAQIEAIKKGGSQPPVRDELPALFGITDKDAKDLLKLLADEGRVVRINDSLYLDKAVLESIKTDLVKFLQEKKEIVVAEFRDIAKTSRKFAVPILEYLDSQKLTQRVGDKRVLRG